VWFILAQLQIARLSEYIDIKSWNIERVDALR
jgi:hypothetical protein